MRSTKAFFLLMLALVIGLLLFDKIRNTYFSDELISPIARLKTIFIIVAGTIIMKKFLTAKGFRLFLITYAMVWVIYYGLGFAANHIQAFAGILIFYKKILPLISPLPFIFFWVIDKVFFAQKEEIS